MLGFLKSIIVTQCALFYLFIYLFPQGLKGDPGPVGPVGPRGSKVSESAVQTEMDMIIIFVLF